VAYRAIRTFVIAIALAVPMLAAPDASRQDADRLRAKISAIVTNGSAARPVPRRTEVLEREVNAYIVHELKEEIPVGVLEPTVTIVGAGRLAGRAVVDLDAVRQSRKRGMLDPMNLLSGRLPVNATGTLTSNAGVGQFTLESANISGIPMPKLVLQELVTYYSRSPERPNGQPRRSVELPAGIADQWPKGRRWCPIAAGCQSLPPPPYHI
jgi:hypothetical protein